MSLDNLHRSVVIYNPQTVKSPKKNPICELRTACGSPVIRRENPDHVKLIPHRGGRTAYPIRRRTPPNATGTNNSAPVSRPKHLVIRRLSRSTNNYLMWALKQTAYPRRRDPVPIRVRMFDIFDEWTIFEFAN